MAKSIEDSFADWEGDTFGFGYGSGEDHTIAAVRSFMAACPGEGCYDHKALESSLTPTVAWLLINTLAKANILEYGTSPRYAWLTPQGQKLRAFMLSKTVDELSEMTNRSEDCSPCYPNACNCGPEGYQAGVKCDNPFWR